MKNGFTLVELLAVIVLLSLLMVIAVPNVLKISSRVKNKAYDTKIELIEQGGTSYGSTIKNNVKKGLNKDGNYYTCLYEYEKDKIKNVNYKSVDSSYIPVENEYFCIRLKLEDLVSYDAIDWDNKDMCTDNCDTPEKVKNYNNTIVNPNTNYIINKCYVYIYYKNNRIYSHFDRNTCDLKTDGIEDGKAYPAIK